jgi:hypothetical protein
MECSAIKILKTSSDSKSNILCGIKSILNFQVSLSNKMMVYIWYWSTTITLFTKKGAFLKSYTTYTDLI